MTTLRKLRREIEHTLVWCAVDLHPSDELSPTDIAKAMERLPDEDEDLERLQLEIRYCLGIHRSLATVLGDEELSDRVLRQLLMTLEVEITSRLTGEPKRRLPFEERGFRGSSRDSLVY